MRSLIRPPPGHGRLLRPLPPRSTAHPLPEAPPTPSGARRAREKRPALGGRAGGGEGGEGRRGGAGGAPPPGALPAGGRAGSWSGKFQAGGRVSPALPSHTAPQRRFSPPPDSSRRASQPVRAAPRACCGQRARLPSPPRTLPVGAAAPRRGAGLSAGLDGAVRRLAGTRGAPPLPGGRGSAHIVLAARPSPLPPPPPVPLSSLPRSLLPSSPALYKSPAPADPPTAGDPGTLAPGGGILPPPADRWDFALPPLTPSRSRPPSLTRFPPASSLRNREARMSEKRVEEAPAELSAKERKEKKEKLEEKAVHKEKKKEIVEVRLF
ncbi:parathymosin isoform X1 [Motacilla alba alba]|uniref:parathymosin isoform X1 n=1 Tax=Motacilla alba alba TaxID=1094192 RepID=UPI0018D53853|nr:parathymosin isoform X1 [Motacilla alba alba]